MTPPPEYFRLCDSSTPGAQRVGPSWYTWHDSSCLYAMLKDTPDQIRALKAELAQAEHENSRLRREVDTLENEKD